MKITRLFNTTACATAVAMALSSNVAIAADEEIERIEVTGSHIKRSDMEGPSPVQVMSADEIRATGANDLIGALQKLPIAGTGTFSTQANSSDDTANGGSSIALRGLGADKTLVLINGRRVAVSPFAKDIDTAFVDLNNIPMSAVKRVEILKDGASATYGSDAIAGVVNVIIRDDIDGMEFTGKYGGTEDGGGDETSMSLLWGESTDKSSHTVIVDYFKRKPIFYGNRDYSASADQTWRGGDDFRSSSGFPGTIRLDQSQFTPEQLEQLSTTNPGALDWYADIYGNDTCPQDMITQQDFGTICRYDYAPVMSLMPETERVGFNYLGKRQLTDDIEGFAEVSVQHSSTEVHGAGSPSFDELFMSADNANHPFLNDVTHPLYNMPLTMRRRMVEIGNRKKETDTDYYRFIIGAEGTFWDDWTWESAYSNIRSNSTEHGFDGYPNSVRLQQAIDSGMYNPFEPSQNSQEALDFFETQTIRDGTSKMETFDVTVTGDLFELSTGMVGFAFGFEYKKESISDNPDGQYLRGEIFGTEATQANGARNNKAYFTEVSIPALEDLEIQLAVRHERYSDFGTTTDPKVAFRWAPQDNLTLRGSWGTAFKAPSLVHLGLGQTNESPNLVDPWRCAVTGADFDCNPREYTSTVRGNPNLDPEESENFNFGLIFEPTDNLNIGIDYWNYDIDDLISRNAQFIVNKFGNDPDLVTREPSIGGVPGQITNIIDTFVNFGGLETDGIDFDIGYKMDTSFGEFKFSYILTYTLSYDEERPTAEVDANGNPVFGDVDLNGEFEHPEYRWTTTIDWAKDDWSANVRVNYIDSYNDDVEAGITDHEVSSWTSVDTSVTYLGFDDIKLTVGATNLFDKEPPFAKGDFMGFDTKTHSAQGRFAYAQFSIAF